MNSMTGFGRATQIVDGLQCIIEIKSVNSRFLDLNIRSPKQVNSVEHSIRKCIQKPYIEAKLMCCNIAGCRRIEKNSS